MTLNSEAERTGFIRDNLEKVYRLLDILEYIDSNELLRESLVLKGGTAINLAVFDLPRLSVDIDLDFSRDCTRSEMLTARQEIEEAMGRYMAANGYAVDLGRGKTAHALSSEAFSYQNSAGNKDNIKVEINYSMRCHVLPVNNTEIYFDFMRTPVRVKTLDETELFGTKIKALLERTAARDLFDINNMITNGTVSLSDYEMLRKCVLFYKTVGCTGTYSERININRIDELSFTRIRQTLLPVLRKSAYVDLPGMKENVKQFLSELMIPDDKEQQYLHDFGKGYYRPELLFENKDILERIKNHPMAIWKTQKMREEQER